MDIFQEFQTWSSNFGKGKSWISTSKNEPENWNVEQACKRMPRRQILWLHPSRILAIFESSADFEVAYWIPFMVGEAIFPISRTSKFLKQFLKRIRGSITTIVFIPASKANNSLFCLGEMMKIYTGPLLYQWLIWSSKIFLKNQLSVRSTRQS